MTALRFQTGGETSDIPGLPSGEERGKGRDILQLVKRYIKKKKKSY